MGLMDYLATMAEMGQKGQGGGLLGAAIMTEVKKETDEKASRPKPGVFCRKVCLVNDERCTPCVALQEEFGSLLLQVERMEQIEQFPPEQVQQLVQSKTITECSLCGAPYKKGDSSCPFCGTPYPEDAIDFDIPISKQERHNQLLSKAEEAWNVWVKIFNLQNKYAKESPMPGFIGAVQKIGLGLADSLQGFMEQNGSEIQQAANHYGVSISQYLYGASQDQMQSWKNISTQERLKAKTEQDNKRHEATMALLEAQRKSNAEFWERRSKQLVASTPHYQGSADSCVNCMHWMEREHACTLNSGTYYAHNVCIKHSKK